MRALSLLALLLLALNACHEAVAPIPTPTLTVTIGAQVGREREWPEFSGDTVRLNNSPHDQDGLAGVEIAFTGVHATGMLLVDADDLKERGEPHFDVPEHGRVTARLRLVQDGELVAEGTAAWTLRPAIQWELEIERSPYPWRAFLDPEQDLDDQPPLRCAYWWCEGVWRFDISEDGVNYSGEALWMTLWGVDPTSCVDIC